MSFELTKSVADIITLTNSKISVSRAQIFARVGAKYWHKVNDLVKATSRRGGSHASASKQAHQRIRGIKSMIESATTLGGIIVIHHRDAKDVFKAVRAVLVKEHADSINFSDEKITELL